jgi:hypothetical protein
VFAIDFAPAVRDDRERRELAYAAIAAGVLLMLAACTRPLGLTASVSPETTPVQVTPSAAPSPSPEPTPSPAALAITGAPFHSGEVGLGYASVSLAATGGLPPYSWSISSGALPAGLKLSVDTVSGFPTAAGSFSFAVHVTDSAGAAVTKKAAVTIYRALTVSEKCAGQCVVGAGCSRCGNFGGVAGGLAPFSFRLVAGALPKGMSLAGLSLKGGFPQGSFAQTVLVTDHLGVQATVQANWSVYGPAKLTAGAGCVDSANPPLCSAVRWSYSGGSPSAAPKVVILGYSQYCDPTNASCYPLPTAPPPGWSAVASGGVISISAGGIACNAIPSTYAGYLTLALVDTAACATTQQSNQARLLVHISNNC